MHKTMLPNLRQGGILKTAREVISKHRSGDLRQQGKPVRKYQQQHQTIPDHLPHQFCLCRISRSIF